MKFFVSLASFNIFCSQISPCFYGSFGWVVIPSKAMQLPCSIMRRYTFGISEEKHHCTACPKVLSKFGACEPQNWPLVTKSSQNYIHFRILEASICVLTKEVCNRGVACSLLKLGSLEKTVIASLFHSGLHSGTIFCGKNDVICHFREQQYMSFF